ncbi:ferric reductase like transmembrane component-domain-containing protein [Coniella lustricola]|uniref:Ferric reductase like transmembrane component-domain-containing protein n=1 Tax=Coniella lustricola TaxID=2025994 RepID=A0A2T3A6I9_9PEZI|nr:ferric reductase like transmembrane component-domain-containing protein [Coniella lustricola]
MPSGSAGSNSAIDPDVENQLLSDYMYYVLTGGAVLVIAYTVYIKSIRYLRTVSSLGNSTQTYFARESWKSAFFKRSIQYSPVVHKRHNREFALSSAMNMGTLPTRLQLFILIGYVAANIAFCVTDITFHSNFDSWIDLLRNRTGVLGVVNMVPLFLMAGRNNPLIKWLGISFDTFNLLHRWLGRITALEIIAHTLCYWIGGAADSSFSAVFAKTLQSDFLLWGFIGTVGAAFLLIQSPSVLRHAWYEVFKILHIAGAAVTLIGAWYHCQMKSFPQLNYLYAVIALWAFDRAARAIRVAYGNIGAGGTKTIVEALPGNACRVTITMARPWAFAPGQHSYLYFPTISWTQSHPFSVGWSEESEMHDGEKLSMDRNDILGNRKTSHSYIIRARTGFTGALYKKAAACPDGRLITTCLVEGPYGGLHNMNSYGTVMLFAGGVGITQAVPHVRDLVAGYSNGTVAARKIVLVWIIQSPEHLEWIRPWMTEILAMDRRRECLRIMLFVSRPRSTKEIHSPSSTVQMFPGRPNIEHLIGAEMENQVGALGVTVCGPGALSDEVRLAVRNRQYYGTIEFCEEAFSW